MTLRVAVIGAGAAGLVALRHLSARPNVFQAVVYEQTPHVGGTWFYTDETGKDKHGRPIHSSMYKYLKTNLPKECMAFPDYPFSTNLPSFMTHQEVQKYLEDYAAHFDLLKFVKFYTAVERVHPVRADGDKLSWDVQVRDVRDKDSSLQTEHFDAVIVCNGHYSVPLIPQLPGLELFQGQVIHSHNYRIPEAFKGRTVLCLGAGSSGTDIAIELSSFAKKVYLSHEKPRIESPLAANVTQTDGLQEVKSESVVLVNGDELEVDVLLLCTGYHFTFPFLTSACNLSINEERVFPLYKHIIHTEHTSLSFIGICKLVCPFPMFDTQVRFVLASLSGDMQLPSSEEMREEIEKDYAWRLSQGMPHRHAHTMRSLQWEYNKDLASLAGFEPPANVVENLYTYVEFLRKTDLPNYKKKEFEITGSDTFCEQVGVS